MFVGLCQCLLSMFSLIWCTLKKRLYLYGTLHVWEIAGKCSQTSLPKCVKTNLFLQAKHNMVTSKVVLCDQFKGEINFQHFG